MPKRTKEYDPQIAKRLKEPNYALNYLLSLQHNHDMAFKPALAFLIDQVGHAELSRMTGLHPGNVTRTVKKLRENSKNIKIETLEVILNAFGLELGFQPSLKQGAS